MVSPVPANERNAISVVRTVRQTFAITILLGTFVAAFATSPSAAPLQKPDQIRGNCSSDDTYFPPDRNGAYSCVKKDGAGIVCGGASEEYKKTCETWSGTGGPPGRAPEAVRSAAQKKADKAKASKPTADKPTADNPSTKRPATDDPSANKPSANKPSTDKIADKPPPAKSADVHDCLGIKLNCGSWAPKDGNTCRTCQLAQCKTENGKDVVAGNKTQHQCYEGHGAPSQDLK